MNNLADSYAAWWISAHDVAHGLTETRPTTDYLAVGDQAAQLLATSQIANVAASRKQELAAALLVQIILIDISIEHAKRNPRQLRAISAVVAQGARKMGVDLSTMPLTDTGFATVGK